MATSRSPPSPATGLSRLPQHPCNVPCLLAGRIERVLASIASRLTRPSPLFGQVGIRVFTFEACSDLAHVTARWIAQRPRRPLSRGLPASPRSASSAPGMIVACRREQNAVLAAT